MESLFDSIWFNLNQLNQLIDGYHCVYAGAQLSPWKQEHTLQL